MDDVQAVTEGELRIERLFAAPPETVFDYWIKPELLATWFGPEGCEIPEYEIDPKEGGAYAITIRNSDCAQHKVSGAWKTIDRPSRLVFGWAWDSEDGVRGHETEVTVTFEAVPGGTKLVLLQRTFESAEVCGMHGVGWNSSFNSLDKVLAQNS